MSVSQDHEHSNTAVTSGSARHGAEFADALYALTHRLGPPDFTTGQKEALASHLVDCAVAYVLRKNNGDRP